MEQQELEKIVLDNFFIDDYPYFKEFRNQLFFLKLDNRTVNDAGMFVNYIIPDEHRVENINGKLNDVVGYVNNQKINEELFFILYIVNGKISTLEGFSTDTWPAQYDNKIKIQNLETGKEGSSINWINSNFKKTQEKIEKMAIDAFFHWNNPSLESFKKQVPYLKVVKRNITNEELFVEYNIKIKINDENINTTLQYVTTDIENGAENILIFELLIKNGRIHKLHGFSKKHEWPQNYNYITNMYYEISSNKKIQLP